jgi:predicted phage-related endonuclease
MMANDQADFAPEVRNGAWWSGDSRKVANGRAVDVVLTKQGKLPIEDISHLENVRMGHVMQPVIGNLFQDKHGIELKDADYALAHPTNDWFRSHFDFISADGRTLVEAKNYNAGVRNKFDSDANVVPSADYAQLVHECACHGISDIYLAVLFGGQEFVTFHFEISQGEIDDLIKKMAVFWGHVKAQTIPEPQTVEQTKIVYPIGQEGSITATNQLEMAVTQLKDIKNQIKNLEGGAETLETLIRNALADKETLQSIDGTILATWKNSKPSKRFSSTLFQQAMPDIYEQFVVEQPGARRFLIK